MLKETNKEFGFREGDLENIIELLRTEADVIDEALIFGSRAKGNYKTGSDVDIALKGGGVTHETVRNISFLLNEETLMPYHFDILNYNDISNKELTEHIDRVGKVIYSRKQN